MNKIKRLAITGAAAGLFLSSAVGAFAAQPASPGCFGQDRAEYIHTVFQTDPAEPGASEWGHEAANRAGTNGEQNRAYKAFCGGVPVVIP